MRSGAVSLVLLLALSAGACSQNSPTAASSAATVVVVGASAAPAGLPGYVIDTGGAGTSDVPLTCSDQVCFETIQLQNTGPGCVTNVDGQINIYAAPPSLTSSLSTKGECLLIPNNPVLAPGQVVSVNVAVPMPASLSVSYAVTLALNWSTPSCP